MTNQVEMKDLENLAKAVIDRMFRDGLNADKLVSLDEQTFLDTIVGYMTIELKARSEFYNTLKSNKEAKAELVNWLFHSLAK